jgi:hypothetical protein
LPFWMMYTTKLSTQGQISNCWSSILQNPHGGLDALSVTNIEVQNKCLLSKWLFKIINEDGL